MLAQYVPAYYAYHYAGIFDAGLHNYVCFIFIYNYVAIYLYIQSCRYIEEKEEAIAKITGEIQRLNDLLNLKGDDIQEKDEKINELEEEFKIVKAELKEAKENAKKNAEEIKELPGALKAKEDQIQSLRDKLFKSENDRYVF